MKKMMSDDRYGLTKAVIVELKKQTRRSMKNQSGNLAGQIKFTKKGSSLVYVRADFDNGISEDCPYAIGEIVAVAQSYYTIMESSVKVPYKFDISMTSHKGWTNKMFVCADLMPHQIRILDVRAERLQDITDEDCLKEGIHKASIGYYIKGLIANWKKESHTEHEDGKCYKLFPTPKQAFSALIDKISGKGTWDSNPFVWRIEFERIK